MCARFAEDQGDVMRFFRSPAERQRLRERAIAREAGAVRATVREIKEDRAGHGVRRGRSPRDLQDIDFEVAERERLWAREFTPEEIRERRESGIEREELRAKRARNWVTAAFVALVVAGAVALWLTSPQAESVPVAELPGFSHPGDTSLPFITATLALGFATVGMIAGGFGTIGLFEAAFDPTWSAKTIRSNRLAGLRQAATGFLLLLVALVMVVWAQSTLPKSDFRVLSTHDRTVETVTDSHRELGGSGHRDRVSVVTFDGDSEHRFEFRHVGDEIKPGDVIVDLQCEVEPRQDGVYSCQLL